MTTGLERIAAKAKVEPRLKFTSLAYHLSAERILKCLQAIPNATGIGVDEVDVLEAKDSYKEWLPTMLKAIHSKGYRVPPVRRVHIPKPRKSEKRPIGVPTVTDGPLQKAVCEILTPIYECDFISCSYGGRPEKSAHMALSKLRETICTRKVSWILEADLKNFFGSMNHRWIMTFMQERISDPRILSLLRRWLKAGVLEQGILQSVDRGTPQGGPISVLISNVYLHYVLDLWIEKIVKSRMRGEIYFVRYLDDFAICFQYRDDADKVSSILAKRLGKFGLELEPSKTKLIEFGKYARLNSKRYNRPMETLYFLGFTICCGVSNKGRFTVNMKTEKSRFRRSAMAIKERLKTNRHLPLREQCLAINRFLEGRYRYYGVSSNIRALERIYLVVYRCWRKALSSRSQSGYVNWRKYETILKHFPVSKPRIYLIFERMSEMAAL
jgi:group II intron reverse transcriptase/maturase